MADGTSESGFADLLRELKNRSGHSYGTLAKRLHMSTSTLHRYCNGDAVPTDYAPVERLARLCKATPDELVELHRRWVLADAGRRRKQPVREGLDRGEPDRREPMREVPDREVPVREVPVPEGASVSRAGDASEREPEPERVPERGVEPESERGLGLEPELVPGRGRDARPHPRRRTRTVVLAALAVTALLGSVALALTLPSAGAEADAKGGSAAIASGSGSARQHAPTAGARSTSPSPSRTSPQDSGTPSGDKPGAPPTGGASGDSATAAGPPPLTVTTHPYAWEDPCSQHYLINRAPTDVSPPPLEQDAPAWVAVHKAVSSGEQFVTFTVQGTGSDTVVLEGLSVRMAGRRAPLAWNDYAMGYPGVGCGGGVPTRAFTVALDALRPEVVPKAGHRGFPFKVSRSDPEVFYVTADASAYDVSWYLELSWSSGARHGTLRIDDNGRPFRTSGNNGRPAYAFPLGGERWEPASGSDGTSG
ncbi:helix-turn-helix domain-containing protein [Streptomyces sp. NPDC001118]